MINLLYCLDENYNYQALTSMISVLDKSTIKINLYVIHKNLHSFGNVPKIINKHSCCIASGSKILVSSINTNRTKYKNKIYCCGHSEINCIHKWDTSAFGLRKREKRGRTKRVTMYIIRNSGDKLGNSAPCLMCYNMIVKTGIKRIIYSTVDGLIYCKTKDYYTNHISSGMIMNAKHCKIN